MEAIQFTEEQRRWSETTLELGTIAKSLMGNQEEVTAGNFIGTQLVENPNFDQNIPGDSSPVLGNELVQNGSFEEKSAQLILNGEFLNGTDNWDEDGGSTILVGTHEGRFDVADINILDSSTASRITQPFNFTNGARYEIQVEVYLVSGKFKVDASDSVAPLDWISTTETGKWQTLTGYIDAISTTTSDIFLRSGEVAQFYLDSISIKQLDPNDYWNTAAGVGAAVTIKDGSVDIITNGAAAELKQENVFQVGKTYQVTVDATINSGAGVKVGDGADGDIIMDISSTGIKTSSFVATHIDFEIAREGSSASNSVINNVSIKQIIAVDIDLWTTIVPNIESSVKFTEGKATIDYDSDGIPQGECGINQDILSVGKFYNVEVDFKLITGTARLYCGGNFVTLTGTAKRTYSLKCEGTSKLSIVRSSNTDDTKIELYSVNVYESTNVVVNGTGSDSVGLNNDWGTSNLNIESDTINGGIILTNAGAGTQGSISQTVTTIIGVEYRLYAKVDFGDATSFFVWNSVNGYPTAIPTDGISFIDFTATSTTTSIRVYINSTSGEFVNVTDINVSPTTPFNLDSNWDIQAGTGLVANGYGNNNAVESFTAVAGQTYRIEYKVSSYTQGSVRIQIGGTNGTANASVGTFVENLIATNTGDIDIQNVQVGGLNFIGVIDYIKLQSGEQSDTLDMTDQDPKAIWITGGGALKVTDMSGTTSTIDNLPSDKFIDWLRIKKIWLTGTTATGIIGIY